MNRKAETGPGTPPTEQERAQGLQIISGRVRDIPDFPKPGILFKDITPLLSDAATFQVTLRLLEDRVRKLAPSRLVGIESRGFLFAAPLADRLGIGVAPVRKPGKLPYRVVREEYTLEYGSGVLEMHEDAVAGERVVIIDDLLATGGTAAAAARLCQRLGAEVAGHVFVIELAFLPGRRLLGDTQVESLLVYS
ncbi:MAG TPA: adenine phosphoribosyltransferase [Pseudomonadota bacterium]|nr:adenine phosphoribosyltransferase [Pseudomonadota bacterium]